MSDKMNHDEGDSSDLICMDDPIGQGENENEI